MLKTQRSAAGGTKSTYALPRPRGAGGWKVFAYITGGILLLCASILIAVTFGPVSLSPLEVWNIVAHRLGLVSSLSGDITTLQEMTVWNLRLPRALLAALVGAALAMCGVILQSLLRNPLSDPYILGISSGASAGAVLVIVLGVGGSVIGMRGGAFVGAIFSFAVVLLLARMAGGTSDRIVLAGIAATQFFSAITSLVVMLGADPNTTRSVMFWMLGSFGSASWSEVWITCAILVAGMLVCLAVSANLDAMAFGEDAATSLGINVAVLRWMLLFVTAIVTAVAVSTSGVIGFVGLVVPHIARMLVGPGHGRLLPVSMLIGAVMLVWVDSLARTVAEPQEIPVGVFTAVIGVPVFVAVMVKAGGKRS
ncbi:FecCD family ABC transporter permease [Corynebacterium flavescens]|uniref:FecCD family ABC transporter permease n=1 Tax=Corynebacterium flavescens TaxID=28028 RepID=UPI0026490DCD|nr:iron ABC transporter permease [Corynebacterium flavescens]MDN6100204.1 iron ABC transporter permease [Corynebacterium flavescens]MDN6430303.1 iron ABC transporter permease [Corynebacterium flavescens]MDN6474281.1 iron ABC transporter permease [Corynebacterium flavescens]MDN6532232.1 iron ABC transporter permease [Corynebacterium flavescens]MDN6602092.1 iron ABC transporter permease [Corynebacterium flavescens]